MVAATELSSTSETQDLSRLFEQAAQEKLTGYWRIQSNETANGEVWYLAMAQGKVIFSGQGKITWKSLIRTLQRFILRLRAPQASKILQPLQKEVSEPMMLHGILRQLETLKLLTYEDAISAVRQQVLSDLDTYLFEAKGQAEFIEDYELIGLSPIRGFDWQSLYLDVAKRRSQWLQIRRWIPSMRIVPAFNSTTSETSALSQSQIQQLKVLTQDGKTLAAIAKDQGKDPLEVAKTFAHLVKGGLVTTTDPAAKLSTARIFIVDDSEVLVRQFRTLVQTWGYQVYSSSDAMTSVQAMVELDPKPLVIFLDINMPGASGFELIKQIRRQPQISGIPLVLLTAEKAVSNQWRAQWANSKFLSKPKTTQEIPAFRSDLQALLTELVPLPIR